MSGRDKALIMLQVLDLLAPVNINHNHQEEWISAIILGLESVDEEVKKSEQRDHYY